MLIPFTAHSELATRLRENEEKMQEMTGYRLKTVGKGGTKLVDILHKANPWSGQECGRVKCLLCISRKREGKTNSQDCKNRNFVYETYCWTCSQRQDKETEEKFKELKPKEIEQKKRKTRRFLYIGETNVALNTRMTYHFVRSQATC